MKSLKAVIVDDEVDSLGVLEATLARYCPEIGTISSFNDAYTALQGMQVTVVTAPYRSTFS